LAGAARASADEDGHERRRGRARERNDAASRRDVEGSDEARKAKRKTEKSEKSQDEASRRSKSRREDERAGNDDEPRRGRHAEEDGEKPEARRGRRAEEAEEEPEARRRRRAEDDADPVVKSNTSEPPLEGVKRKRVPPHEGFIFAPRVGLQGCVGKICSAQRHRATPGPRVDLFVGRNIGGIFDIGINAGWGMFFAPQPAKTNALTLYGVDLDRYDAFARIAAPLFRFDARELKVQYARLSTARVGAHFRVHFNPSGRFVGYVGVGIGYTFFRGTYVTPPGALRVEFHGFDIPIDAGAAFHVHKRVALGLEGSYIWANYLVAAITHPAQKAVAPISLLQASVMRQDTYLKQDLPKVWSVGFVVRVRL